MARNRGKAGSRGKGANGGVQGGAAPKKPKTGRVMEIVTKPGWEDEDGRVHKLDNEAIQNIIVAHKVIKSWAFICHDRDVYTEDEARASKGAHKAGDKKEDHWHILLKFGSGVYVSHVARWFGVAENFVEVKNGRNAFQDCLVYLTHEDLGQQYQGKYLYPREKVVVSDASLWKYVDDDLFARSLNNGEPVKSNRTLLRVLTRQGGYKLDDLEERYPIDYNDDCVRLSRLRSEYISEEIPVPALRLNFYIEGSAGMGKSSLSRLLAVALAGGEETMRDEEDVYFILGGDNTRFEGYAGQPVIIWDDARAIELIRDFQRGDLLQIFDPHPFKKRMNIKNSSIVLKNSINIVNGVVPFKDFVNGLIGEYRDRDGNLHKAELDEKAQGFRRFPFFIRLSKDDIKLWVSEGWVDDSNEWLHYHAFSRFQNNLKSLMVSSSGCLDFSERWEISDGAFGGVKDSVDGISRKHLGKGDVTVDDIKVFSGDNVLPMDGETHLYFGDGDDPRKKQLPDFGDFGDYPYVPFGGGYYDDDSIFGDDDEVPF